MKTKRYSDTDVRRMLNTPERYAPELIDAADERGIYVASKSYDTRLKLTVEELKERLS